MLAGRNIRSISGIIEMGREVLYLKPLDGVLVDYRGG